MTARKRSDGLEIAIAEIARSYEGPEAINNLESAALPNKRAVVEAYLRLKPVIYLGFFSTKPLEKSTLSSEIRAHLEPAGRLLVEQIERAIRYEEQTDPKRAPHPPGFSEEVVLRLFRSLPQLRRQLNTDLVAAYQGDPAARSIEEIVFSYPTVEAVTAHRIAHVLFSERVPMIPRIISEYAHGQTGIDIHAGARIGDSFFIDHGTGVVIGETCVIGRRVKIYQGVTLGALSTDRAHQNSKRHPTIEDDVTIYAGATILGGDTVIGKGSVIGGNVFLTSSVPPNTKIFGRGRKS